MNTLPRLQASLFSHRKPNAQVVAAANRSARRIHLGATRVIAEAMERRTLLSAVLSADGTLTVMGTPGADTIVVDLSQGTGEQTVVMINGATTTFDGQIVQKEAIFALGGNDIVHLFATDGTVEGSIYGGSGNDKLQEGAFGEPGNPTVYVD